LDADIIAVEEVENEAALKRVFDPAVYTFFVSESVGFQPEPCRGRPEVSLTEQRVGFVVRSSVMTNTALTLKRLPDVISLAIEAEGHRLRPGVELELAIGSTKYQLLAVHLKSSCNNKPLPNDDKSCVALWKQALALQKWIDGHTAAGRRIVVIGDFNRQLAKTGDAMWRLLDDSNPPNSDLELVGKESAHYCGPFEEAIDHIVLDKGSDLLVDEQSLRIIKYDEPWEAGIADHCPMSVVMNFAPALSTSIRWVQDSAEYKALTQATFDRALARLDELIAARAANSMPWTIAIDADETLLDNTGFQTAQDLQFLGFQDGPWRSWVGKAAAGLVPSAKDFLTAVLARKDSKIVIITNRRHEDVKPTIEAFQKQGITFDPTRVCVLGIEDIDRRDNNADAWDRNGWKNDKDRRRGLVREGADTNCWKGFSDEQRVRGSWSQKHEILLQVGDNIHDFEGISQKALRSDAGMRERLAKEIDKSFFLIPNPMYGSWE